VAGSRSRSNHRPRSTRPAPKRRSQATRPRADIGKTQAKNGIGGVTAGASTFAVVALSILVKEVMQHPIASTIIGLLSVCVAVFTVHCWIRLRNQRRLEALAQAREIARYHAMNFADFERALAFLCQRDGCTGVQVVGGAGDLGADVVAYLPDGRKLVIQAKRYAPNNAVTGPHLQKFGGTCFNVHQAQIAAVVTTSRFTRQAQEYAAHMNIRLVDESGLAVWASETGPPPWH
jgi:restriction system protein